MRLQVLKIPIELRKTMLPKYAIVKRSIDNDMNKSPQGQAADKQICLCPAQCTNLYVYLCVFIVYARSGGNRLMPLWALKGVASKTHHPMPSYTRKSPAPKKSFLNSMPLSSWRSLRFCLQEGQRESVCGFCVYIVFSDAAGGNETKEIGNVATWRRRRSCWSLGWIDFPGHCHRHPGHLTTGGVKVRQDTEQDGEREREREGERERERKRKRERERETGIKSSCVWWHDSHENLFLMLFKMCFLASLIYYISYEEVCWKR